MTTLMTWGNSDGTKGRCDAKCYDAACPDCDCMCNGMNHGKGKKTALENTRIHAEDLLEKMGKSELIKDLKIQIPTPGTDLFPETVSYK
jgi:hypothetical protein